MVPRKKGRCYANDVLEQGDTNNYIYSNHANMTMQQGDMNIIFEAVMQMGYHCNLTLHTNAGLLCSLHITLFTHNSTCDITLQLNSIHSNMIKIN